MTAMHLPSKAYQLATEHKLGEPIRVYRTNKRNLFKILGWSIAITYLIFIIAVLTTTPYPFRFTHSTISLYSDVVGIMLFIALIFLVPLLLLPKTMFYICSSGFIMQCKRIYKIVHWEDVEWVTLINGHCIIYLVNKKPMILNRLRLIGHLEILAQEIELKARLIKRPEGQENLETQFEHLLSSQTARNEEKDKRFLGKPLPTEQETVGEALKLQEEHRLGEIIATHYAGFKGILRRKAVGMSIYYLLQLTFVMLFILLLIGTIFRSGFTADKFILPFIVWSLFSSLFRSRFFARYIQLRLYTEGFIYIDGGSFEVVRWEQIEKVIYHKTAPAFSPPFCHIYLTNGDTLMVSGYIHGLSAVKQIFNEHVVNKVQAG